jgi:MraZ protein
MKFFSSNSTHKIDGKGRVSIPAPFRKVLDLEAQPGVVLIPGIRGEGAIEGFGHSRFEELVESIDAMNPLEEETLALADTVMGEAHHLALDENGRIVLGAELKRFAGLDGQALFVGLGRSFQIWNPEAYAERKQSMRDKARANFHRLPWGRKAAPA